ncbi:unnamed protein product [Alternaria alternata]|uniref:Uncharacterized protein n=2 Tax=Alternaria alternata complex TaxID=187734 RepID=A0A4Q4NW37_ALTAL|nr:hypothetical protein AA0115_g8687 [Alternaria tenuissima]RYN84510.1 hypothetical protein AA0117_g1665 [Alternaria alternata]RYN98466.1 hypothetical protein AA0119_g7163 [Alternaria tenuissima]RYO13761.1 hypothetical protein AA0121_g8270 [Alternaria tenuissima]RYO55900.1 hypothetical protein AA0116_g8381 [Alternaria tenuissima]
MTSQLETDASRSPAYPIAYFLCDGVTDAKTLKTALSLSRTPKLRKARIEDYRRSVRSGHGASTLAFDARNWGEWCGTDVVKGVIFEALCLEEERALIQYVGGTGEVKTEKIEVACPSLLGKVGMMKTIRGRIFVPEGDGDTLVGSTRSFMHSERRLEPDETDTVVSSGRSAEGSAMEQEPNSGDFFETGSIAVVDGHPTPRMSPSIATLHDTDVPHQSLDELALAASDEYLEPLAYEHPVDPKIETKDWAATSEVPTTGIDDIKDTRIYQELMEMQEPSKVEAVEESSEIETPNVKDIKDTKVFKAIMEVKEPQEVEAVEEAQETAENTDSYEAFHMEEIKEIDDIDDGSNIQVESEYQRFLLAEQRRSRAISMNTSISGTSTAINDERSMSASATQPWTPSTPWRKEHATAPVRSILTATSPSQSMGTATRMRKTSDSIKSLVGKFENLTPQNTQSKGA